MGVSQPDLAGSGEKMPVLFVGHGSPMNAIEDNAFSRAWIEIGASLSHPQAILCISAHWQTPGARVTAMAMPRTIYDFYGFPQPLYEQRYPVPGSPELARLVQETVPGPVALDLDWGLDHGTWSVLCRMFPHADVPVVQLSLDYGRTPAQHYELGRVLRPLRHRGVLIVGSGNIVHNLRLMCWDDGAYDWAVESDETLRQLIVAGDHRSIVDYERVGRNARLAIPTNEHFVPLLYALAAQDEGDEVQFFADKVTFCAISMRSLVIG